MSMSYLLSLICATRPHYGAEFQYISQSSLLLLAFQLETREAL